MFKEAITKVRYTLKFVLSEFSDFDISLDVWEELDAFKICSMDDRYQLRVPKEKVNASIGDGEYYTLIREFVKEISDETKNTQNGD